MKNLTFHPGFPGQQLGRLGPNRVVITTEDRIGTVARITLVALVSILVGAAFVLVVQMTPAADQLHDVTLVIAAALMSLGVQVFLAPWLVRTLGRRGTWTIDEQGIAWQPRLGRRRFVAWHNVDAVRFLPMAIQIRGTHRLQQSSVTLGSGLLSLDEWNHLRRTIADALLNRFPEIFDRLEEQAAANNRWTSDPRVVHLGALGFLTVMAVFAATLSLQEDLRWPGVLVAAIATVRLAGWIVNHLRTPWQRPAPAGHDDATRIAA